MYPLQTPGIPAEPDAFLARLNQMGESGWQLVSIELGWAFMMKEEDAEQSQPICKCGHRKVEHTMMSGVCIPFAARLCAEHCLKFSEEALV